ncbi:MAG: hypothetical protein GY722_00175 [bacterium]|nr:hypothetical protein [bacterium]
MPQFLNISPTHIEGKKRESWANCLADNCIAIGWMHVDLTGEALHEVDRLIRSYHFPNEASALVSFRRFLSLRVGDYVAVNNAVHGLFGIGIVNSGYRFEPNKYTTGITRGDPRFDTIEHRFYPHLIGVDWKSEEYMLRRDLLAPGEKGWPPFGTTGPLLSDVPDYILRALGERRGAVTATVATAPPAVKFEAPGWLGPVVRAIEALKADSGHQERAHESLVEEFLVALGYRKHEDIKYRQGRIDVALYDGDQPTVAFEVKRDWQLSSRNREVREQVYRYALEQGIRFAAITNGDYYLIYDRMKGLSYDSQLVGEFKLSALQEADLRVIDNLRPGQLREGNGANE